jgi:alpha-D-xyloside xylohydrolase
MKGFYTSGLQSMVRLGLGVVLISSLPVFPYTVTARDSVADGAVFTMSDASKMKVQVCSDKIIRIVYTKRAAFPPADSNYIVVKGTWVPAPFTLSQSATVYSVQTASVKVDVAIATGAVSFYSGGSLILQETAGKTLTQKTVEGNTAYDGTIYFNQILNDEGIYGFGNLQNLPFYIPYNLRGQSLDLMQQNMTDCSPFFMSTRGFGVLWINYSRMTVNTPLTLWCNWATNGVIDYYFIYGPAFDSIIASYRTITGPAPLWPKWAYGFWQCKNRYESQSQILDDIVGQYRSKGYPIDNVVQDWLYYSTPGDNGCQCWDAWRYPDPAGMIRTLHDSLNCHFTISVWPSFNPSAGANYNFMSSRGYLLNSQDYLGTTYDVFNDSATYYYWKFINDSLVSKGVDAFWPDATEPEYYETWVKATTAQGPAEKVENIFPLLHSKTLHDGFRASSFSKGKRVCNLTRSYYAGSQRFGAAYWTGDINVDYQTYMVQIPAGLNVCMSGLPLFCTDVGGFWGETPSDLEVRWFEFGIFNPVFRVHGTRNANELWSWGPATEAILLKYSKLRYRLFPYVYSLAWMVTNEGYTMMRGLPFDFREDANVRDRDDEFMFGPALLVCPVTSDATVTTKSVYLPAGTWYDFWTGAQNTGPQNITADAPLDKIPLFVRAGSILPLGPEITYADTAADPIELRVYTGSNGVFTIYEDEGDNYNYEKGTYATIPISWNETSKDLTIGPTSGSFPGMMTSRTFKVVWVSPEHGVGGTVTTAVDKAITYTGGQITLNKITGEIGIIHPPAIAKDISYTARLNGRNLVVAANGNQHLKVSVIDLNGRLVAARTVRAGSSCVVAERLTPGVYCARFVYSKSIIFRKSIVVPR